MNEFIGVSKLTIGALSKAKSFADEEIPILISGPKGNGKTLLAKIIHKNSKREAENFEIFDAAHSKNIEKDLFGEFKSSILGIENITSGVIDLAGSGTLFIKNLQEFPIELQPQLLATVQLGGYRPLGSNETLKSSCRFIFSIPNHIERFVKEKKILPELALVFSKSTVVIPQLKDRQEDVEALANYFLKKWCESLGQPKREFSKSALKLLKRSSWKGNVSELQTIVLSSVLHFNDKIIEAHHLQLHLENNWHAHTDEQLEEIALEDLVEKKLNQFMHRLGKYDIEDLHTAIMSRVERPLIKIVMERVKNNQLKAARMLGINRNTLRTKLQRLELK